MEAVDVRERVTSPLDEEGPRNLGCGRVDRGVRSKQLLGEPKDVEGERRDIT